jgi:hypothetical protein
MRTLMPVWDSSGESRLKDPAFRPVLNRQFAGGRLLRNASSPARVIASSRFLPTVE